MKKVLILFTALLVLFSTTALADTTINVPGSGSVYVSADMATVTLGVRIQDSDVKKAQASVNETIAKIRQALMDAGVNKEDINTDYINIYPVYDYSSSFERLSAYEVSSSLAIRTMDLDNVGTLIDLAFAAGANNLSSINFTATDTVAAQEEALRTAIANARRQAEIIADASGLVITGIEGIYENGAYSYDTGVSNFTRKEAALAEEDAATVVQAAKICVEANINITYKAAEAK